MNGLLCPGYSSSSYFNKTFIYRAIKLFMFCIPSVQSLVDEAMDVIFAPKVVVRKLALAIALEAGMVSTLKVHVSPPKPSLS